MKIPLSWLKEYVDIEMPIEELSQRLTLAGLEVEELQYVGLPLPGEDGRDGDLRPGTKVTGLSWDPDKILVGAILEVMPHPNADRLVLCRLDDGSQVHTVLTGAPNLFHLKGAGPLDQPLKTAFALEGACIFDGHKPGQELMVLKRARIRGVESYSMACSEKELGISEEHEGIIILDADAPVGMPLVDYMGDAVFDIAITPNIARNANVYGVAREVAALTGAKLKPLELDLDWTGPALKGRVSLEIQEPELNPRFVLGLIEGVQIRPSPYWLQRRLRLAGMRPINNIVDATNYIMLALGEPLHAFDFDLLKERAGGENPKIITRRAQAGEHLTTLDGEDHALDDYTVLVTDTAGALSIAGVMGGAETEISEATTSVLLEGAAWNYINIRRTIASLRMSSEASYRFSRGVHPALAEHGVRLGLKLMQSLAGGDIAQGLVDAYPAPPLDPTVEISPADTERWLGIRLEAEQMADILRRLQFSVEVEGDVVRATTPPHRMDIGEGVIGRADLMEEIARIYGYDRIPETQIADTIPPQYGNKELDKEERVRDLMVGLGLQEVITYRQTTPEREARILPPGSRDPRPYVELANPISTDRVVMRQSLMASVLEIVERNARFESRIGLFEIGPEYLLVPGDALPREPLRLVLALTGAREQPSWKGADQGPMDFYDLKGILEGLLQGLHLPAAYQVAEEPSFHPGKCAQVVLEDQVIGTFGELHPLVHQQFAFNPHPVLVADLDLEKLLQCIPDRVMSAPISAFPPVLEDLAFVVDEEVTAAVMEAIIRQAAGKLLAEIELFDLYRGDQVGPGKKSLAYSLVYQAPDRTLTDDEVAKVRARIIRRTESELGAKLREK